jgi:hypothetical protein
MAMARCLVTYIADPDRVFKAIRAEFGSSPCHDTIRHLREAHLKPAYYSEPFKPHDGYYPRDAADSLAKTNALFLLRLQDERTLSLALRDRFKRVPELVE